MWNNEPGPPRTPEVTRNEGESSADISYNFVNTTRGLVQDRESSL